MMSINQDNMIAPAQINNALDTPHSIQCPPTQNNLQTLQQLYLQSRCPAQHQCKRLNVDLDGFELQLQLQDNNFGGLSMASISPTCNNHVDDLVSTKTSSNTDYFVPLPQKSIATPSMTQRRIQRYNYPTAAASSQSFDRSLVGLVRVGSPTSVLQDRSLGSVASPASPLCSQPTAAAAAVLASSFLDNTSKPSLQQLQNQVLQKHQHQHQSRQSQHSQPHPQVLSVHASAQQLQQARSKQGSDCVNNNNNNYNYQTTNSNNFNNANNFGQLDSSLSMLSLGLHMHQAASPGGRINNIPSQHDRPGTNKHTKANIHNPTSTSTPTPRVAEDCRIINNINFNNNNNNNYAINLKTQFSDGGSSSSLSDIQSSLQLNSNVRTKSTDSIQSSDVFSVQESAVGDCQQQQVVQQQEQQQQQQQQQQKSQKQQQQLKSKQQQQQQLPDLWAQFLNPSGNFKYKTEICTAWSETQTCKFGDKCDFAHGVDELKRIDRHPKYKTEVCRTFAQEGYCQYGIRCRFIHKVEQDRCEDASDAPAPVSPKPQPQSLSELEQATDKQTRLSIFQQLANNSHNSNSSSSVLSYYASNSSSSSSSQSSIFFTSS